MAGPWEDYGSVSGPWSDYAKPAAAPNPIVDAARGALTGIQEGVSGLVGAVGDLRQLPTQAVNAEADFLARHKVLTQDQAAQAKATLAADGAPFAGIGKAPTSADVNTARQKITGPDYQPQTAAGRFARTIASFVPNALFAGETLPAKAAMVVVPGIGSEAAGEAAQGTPYEAAARVAGAVAGGIGAGLATAPRSLSAVTLKPGPVEQATAAFDKAGVQPSVASIGGKGAASVAQAVAGNPVIGIPSRMRMANALSQTADAVDRTAAAYGTPADRTATGDAVQQGIRGYASGTGAALPPDVVRSLPSKQVTFGDKSSALYDAAERLIGPTDKPIPMTNTAAALSSIMGQFKTPELAVRFTNPKIVGIAQDLVANNGRLPWSDAAGLRTTIRTTLKADPALRGTISDAQVDNLYSALTQDLQSGAADIGGPEAGRAWQQANQFYAGGMKRINGALQSFVGTSGSPVAPERAYDLILQAASNKAGANAGRLGALKQSLPPDKWGDVAASVVDRMGASTPGAADQGPFSVSRFVTNYANLSDRGKGILFGNGALRSELENLNSVASMQKGVERAANHSNTAVAAQTIGSLGAIGAAVVNPAAVVPVGGLLGGMALTGEMMTNPVAVRALVQLERAAQASPKALSAQMGNLRIAAKRNAVLLPVYEQASRAIGPSAQPAINGPGDQAVR